MKKSKLKSYENKIKFFIKKYSKKSPVSYILIALLIIIFAISSVKLLNWNNNRNKNNKINNDIEEKVTDTDQKNDQLNIKFDELLQINPDSVAWIRYNDKKVNYPVVQAKDNAYYLNKAFDRSENELGSIFLDYRNNGFNDLNTVIYGHNSYDVTMFGSLKDVFNPSFFENDANNYIEIALPSGNFKYQIFSVYTIETEEYYITPSPKNYEKFLTTMIERSELEFDVEMDTNDKMLTLSTCYGWKVGGTTARLVIHAKLIK